MNNFDNPSADPQRGRHRTIPDRECGPLDNKVASCDTLKSKTECEGDGPFVNKRQWFADPKDYYNTFNCKWQGGKCVKGVPCDCSAAPFELDLTNLSGGAPSECEYLNARACRSFQNNAGQRCVLNSLNKCSSPLSTDPYCFYETDADTKFYTSQDCQFGFGTKLTCDELCLHKDPKLKGSSTELFNYKCLFNDYGRFCECSY